MFSFNEGNCNIYYIWVVHYWIWNRKILELNNLIVPNSYSAIMNQKRRDRQEYSLCIVHTSGEQSCGEKRVGGHHFWLGAANSPNYHRGKLYEDRRLCVPSAKQVNDSLLLEFHINQLQTFLQDHFISSRELQK